VTARRSRREEEGKGTREQGYEKEKIR